MTLEDIRPDNSRHSTASRQDRLSQKVRLYGSDLPRRRSRSRCVQNPFRNQGRTISHVTGFRELAAQNRCSGARVTTCRYIGAARRCDETISERQGEGLKESVSLDVN
jgi:hypothetical protein